jgi:hypothetical protein
VAFVLGARPSMPSVLPHKTERGWLLGSVKFSAGYLRRLPIAMAPFALAPLGLWWAVVLLHPASWPVYGVHAWVVAALLTASFPSAADFRLAWPALLLAAVIAAAAWWLR